MPSRPLFRAHVLRESSSSRTSIRPLSGAPRSQCGKPPTTSTAPSRSASPARRAASPRSRRRTSYTPSATTTARKRRGGRERCTGKPGKAGRSHDGRRRPAGREPSSRGTSCCPAVSSSGRTSAAGAHFAPPCRSRCRRGAMSGRDRSTGFAAAARSTRPSSRTSSAHARSGTTRTATSAN